jgi:hypothetical protein
MCGCTYKLAIALPNNRLRQSLGTANRTSPATTPQRHQRVHQPRVIAGRVAANHEHQIGMMQVFELDRRGAAASDRGESDAARLVTVVAAVVDVIRTVEPGEQLQQKTGLVTAAAAEVPKRLVGGRRSQLPSDPLQRVFPRNRRVAAGVARVEHWLDQSAAGFQLARRELLQLAGREPLPEVAADRPLHVGDHRLQALLADGGKLAQLVDHAAALPAHAQRARLAGVLRPHRPPQLDEAARLAGLPPGITDGRPAPALLVFPHVHLRWFNESRPRRRRDW